MIEFLNDFKIFFPLIIGTVLLLVYAVIYSTKRSEDGTKPAILIRNTTWLGLITIIITGLLIINNPIKNTIFFYNSLVIGTSVYIVTFLEYFKQRRVLFLVSIFLRLALSADVTYASGDIPDLNKGIPDLNKDIPNLNETPPISDSGSVNSGSVNSGEVESGSVNSGSVNSGEVESGSVNSGSVESGSVSSDQHHTDRPNKLQKYRSLNNLNNFYRGYRLCKITKKK